LGSLWGTKIALGVGVNLTSCSTYSCVLSSDPGSDWSSKHTVKKAYVASVLGWSEVPYPTGVGVRGFGVQTPLIYVPKWDTNIWPPFTLSRRCAETYGTHCTVPLFRFQLHHWGSTMLNPTYNTQHDSINYPKTWPIGVWANWAPIGRRKQHPNKPKKRGVCK
jgi:hypothetical protein